ncbi:MAG: hypothetical protein P8M78_02925, partial [Myxococcota bacterium]|nr:hypothetical protein [Myxococcota bacterium]
MEKLAYLLHEGLEVAGSDLRDALMTKAVPGMRKAGADQIGLSVDDEHVAEGQAVAIRRAEPPVRALVTFWMQNSDDRGPCEEILSNHASRLDGYLVVESRPLV